MDIKDINLGDPDFYDTIVSGINNSTALILFVSDDSCSSRWVKNEVTYAINNNKLIIPILLSGAKLKGWMDLILNSYDYIDSDNELQMSKLINEVTRINRL